MKLLTPSILILAACFLVTGCIPVSSVIGRSAGTVSHPTSLIGAGLNYVDLKARNDGETDDNESGYFHLSIINPAGPRTDVQVGINNMAPFIVVRRQLLGLPMRSTPSANTRSFPLDLSVDLGVDGWGFAGAIYSGHIGINLSVRNSRFVPYLAYRYHIVNITTSGSESEVFPFNHQMFFAGLELVRRSDADRTIVIELFYGNAPSFEVLDPEAEFEQFGLNVIFGRPLSPSSLE